MRNKHNKKIPVNERKEFFEDQKRSLEFPLEENFPTEHNVMLKHEKRQ